MKQTFSIISVIFLFLISNYAYSLNNFNYIGIAFDGSGNILASQSVTVNVQLIENGVVVYEENHTGVATDQFGAYSITIGTGTVVSGVLGDVNATKNLRIKSTVNSGGVWVVSSILKPTVPLTSGSGNSYWKLSGNSGTTAGSDFIGTTDGVSTEIRVENGGTVNNSLVLNTNGSIRHDNPSSGATYVAGNTRGTNSIDLQSYRTAASQVASGDYATLSGGSRNTASGYIATVGGGAGNDGSGRSSTIAGGEDNTSSGQYSFVGGGRHNIAGGYASAVPGGYSNTAHSYGETVIGLYATNYTPIGPDFYNPNDRLFNIGNGTGSTSRSDAFTVYKNGNATLNGSLTVNGGVTITGALNDGASNGSAGQVATADGAGNWSWQTVSGWGLTGNSGTTPGTNFIGTTDGAELNIDVKTGSTLNQSLRINSNGSIYRENSIATAGNTRGNMAVDLQIFRTFATQIAAGDGSVITGGMFNTASSNFSAVVGGYENTASNTYAAVGGGYKNTAGASYSFVGGGNSNNAGGNSATVGGGETNSAGGTHTAIGGGQNNNASSAYAAIGGGRGNTASGSYATVAGGNNNQSTGDYSSVGGGFGNRAVGKYSFVSGGLQAHADKYGQNAFASGNFSSNGDAQTSVFVLRNETSAAGWTNLFLDGSTESISVPSSATWTFHIIVVAKQSGGTTAGAGYEIEGVVTNNGGTATILGTPSITALYESDTNYDVQVTASGANLVVQVEGNGDALRWVARVQTAEVTW